MAGESRVGWVGVTWPRPPPTLLGRAGRKRQEFRLPLIGREDPQGHQEAGPSEQAPSGQQAEPLGPKRQI